MTTVATIGGMTDERRAFVEGIRDFCQRECGTREQQAELTNGFTELHNQELYERMAALDWLGVGIPTEYGGAGGWLYDACLLVEETTRGLAPINGYGTTLVVAGAYEQFGTEDQKRAILGGIARGAVEAISMSEPEAGSDVAAVRCRAQRCDGGFVIDGQKTWCSNAHVAAHILLIARTTSGDDPHQGLTMLSVPAGAPGLEIRRIDTMGGREVNDLFFNECFVPEEAVLGEVDMAWMQLVAGLNVERLAIAAGALGMAQRAFDDTLAYVTERRQFGRPIGRFQALQHRIADLATELECARLLIYSVAARVDEEPGALFPREASMAKLKATELVKRMTLEGLQMMGGYGYATEYGMERLVRLSLMMTIFGGTSEIQRSIIARTYGL